MTDSQRHARREDRRAFLAAHPVLYPMLAALSGPRLVRTPRGVLVNDPSLIRQLLAGAPLDRAGDHTTGGLIARHLEVAAWFNDHERHHREQRARLSSHLERAANTRVATGTLADAAASLATGPIDIAATIHEAVGALTNQLLGVAANPQALAAAAEHVAVTGAAAHLGRPAGVTEAVTRLTALIRNAPTTSTGLLAAFDTDHAPNAVAATAVVAAVTLVATTSAAGTRAVAYLADAHLWDAYLAAPELIIDELLRVLTPSPLLPRVLAAPFTLGATTMPAGTRLLLNLRRATHRTAGWRVRVDAHDPALAQLAFGFGPHVCPGTKVARHTLRQLLDTLAPLAPRVRRRTPGRGGLPRWTDLTIEANR